MRPKKVQLTLRFGNRKLAVRVLRFKRSGTHSNRESLGSLTGQGLV